MGANDAVWTAGSFTITVKDPCFPHLEPQKFPIAGWIKGIWALDFRVFDESRGHDSDLCSGWMLTHLPSGYCAFGILAPLRQAFEIADQIASMGDWPTDSRTRAPVGIRGKVEEAFPNLIATQTLWCRGPAFYALGVPQHG